MTQAVCSYIDDGYLLDGYIKEAPGLYPAVRFKYRPIAPPERVEVFDGWEQISGAEKFQRMSVRMAKNVKSWDLKDARGAAVPCSEPGRYRRLPVALYDRLQEIVFQLSAPDRDPDKDKTEPENFAETTPEGNSSAG